MTGKYDERYANYLDAFWTEHHHAPTFRQIMDACDMPSTSVAHNVVRRVTRERGDTIAKRKGRIASIVPRWVADAISAAQSEGKHE